MFHFQSALRLFALKQLSLDVPVTGTRVAQSPLKPKIIRRSIMLKRTAAIALAITFLSLAIAPETLAHQRNRRAGYYRPTTTYYSPSAYRGVAGTRYYSQP